MADHEIAQSTKDAIVTHLERLLSSREYPKTICPSEVARSVTNQEMQDSGLSDWRDLMPAIRSIAWSRKLSGDIEILQKGQCLPEDSTLENIRGPIRIRKVQ